VSTGHKRSGMGHVAIGDDQVSAKS
jgi:hypothetical protein